MRLPWISTNLAISADGKITSTHRQPSGWTSREDHSRLLQLRQNADALIVGRGTLEADRMTMTVPGKPIQPLRCIVSSTGNIPPDHPVFLQPGGPIHLLVTGASPLQQNPQVSIHRGSLNQMIQTIALIHNIKHLHCEGGGKLIRALAEMDLIDEFHVTIAGHKLFGGMEAPTATGIPAEFLPESRHFEIVHFEPRPDLGECFLSYRRRGNWQGSTGRSGE